MRNTTNVFIADDHQAIVDGIKSNLRQEDDLKYVGQANNVPELRNRLKSDIDVLLLDVFLEDKNEFYDLIQEIRTQHPNLCILILTKNKSLKFAERTVSHGARGFLSKTLGLQDIFQSIREAIRFPHMTIVKIPYPDTVEEDRDRMLELLTPRQLQVISLLCKGCKNNEEIADFLYKINKRRITAEGVKAHRRDIRKRLKDDFEISNDTSLGYWVGKLNLLDGSELSSTEDDQ